MSMLAMPYFMTLFVRHDTHDVVETREKVHSRARQPDAHDDDGRRAMAD